MSKNYDILYIQRYLDGNLSHKDMHQLELDALEDAMLQDAIEGFRASKAINHKHLSLLQQRLEARIEEQQVKKNVFFFTGQRLAIASVAGVMLIVFSVLFWMTNSPRVEDQAAKLGEHTKAVLQIQEKAKVTSIAGSAIPKEGWNNFRDYLSVNGARIAVGEKVRLHVDVQEGRTQNIKIVFSSSEQTSNEIIRLLQEGPLWNGKSGEFTIEF